MNFNDVASSSSMNELSWSLLSVRCAPVGATSLTERQTLDRILELREKMPSLLNENEEIQRYCHLINRDQYMYESLSSTLK
jgi:hypothetical protein